MVRRLVAVLAVLVVLGAAVACGSGSGSRQAERSAPQRQATPPAPTSTTLAPNVSVVAEVRVPSIAVYDTPEAPQPSRTMSNPGEYGEPLVFLVKDQRPDWLNVYVPVRPNGTTGWIRPADVELITSDFRIVVERGLRRITVWQGNQVFLQEPVGVGTTSTPTPLGLFYIRFLYNSQDEADFRKYGPYAYPISAFSEVLIDFMGGKGEVGLHGTHNPADLGKEVSNGCIRMTNDTMAKLAPVLPAGSPVEILP